MEGEIVKTSTNQGVDPSDPAEGVRKQAPLLSSYNHCNDFKNGGPQAKTATGTNAQEEVVLTNKALADLRNKPRSRSLDLSAKTTQLLELTWDEEEARSLPAKRKRAEWDTGAFTKQRGKEELLFEKFRKLLNQASKTSKRLAKIIAEVPNTKVEIKEVGREIISLMSQLTTRDMETMLDNLETGKAGNGGTKYVIVQTTEGTKDADTQIPAKQTRDMGTQTTPWHKDDSARKIEEELEREERNEEGFEKIVDLQWPERVYRNTTLSEGGDILTEEARIGFWLLKDTEAAEGTVKKIRKRHPLIKEIPMKPVGMMSVTTRGIDRDGNHKTRDSCFYKLYQGNTSGDQMETTRALKTILELEGESGCEKIVIVAPKMRAEEHRKMLEFIFRGSTIKVVIHEDPGETRDTKTSRPKAEEGIAARYKDKKKTQDEALIISAGGGEPIQTC